METNVISRLTWRWVRANSVKVDLPDLEYKNFTKFPSLPNRDDSFEREFMDMSYGLSPELLDINKSYLNWNNVIETTCNCDKGEKFEVILTEKENRINDRQRIKVGKNSKAEFIFDYRQEGDFECFRNTLFEIIGEENSQLKLILIQRFGLGTDSFLSLVAKLHESARLEVVQVELGAKKTFTNMVANLVGKESDFSLKAVYIGDKNRQLDFSYLVNHIAEATKSDMLVNGMLREGANKRFAGTLDFKKGSVKSVGNEEEYVTLLDDDVRNVAVPLLLSHEDDIVGNHAASAGRVDPDILFYIMSRGFTEDEAKSLIVEASMAPTMDLIEDETLREDLKRNIHEGIVNR